MLRSTLGPAVCRNPDNMSDLREFDSWLTVISCGGQYAPSFQGLYFEGLGN